MDSRGPETTAMMSWQGWFGCDVIDNGRQVSSRLIRVSLALVFSWICMCVEKAISSRWGNRHFLCTSCPPRGQPCAGKGRGGGREDPIITPTEPPRCGDVSPAGFTCVPCSLLSTPNNKKGHLSTAHCCLQISLGLEMALGKGWWKGLKKSGHLMCSKLCAHRVYYNSNTIKQIKHLKIGKERKTSPLISPQNKYLYESEGSVPLSGQDAEDATPWHKANIDRPTEQTAPK